MTNDPAALRCAIFLDLDNLLSGLRDGAGPEYALRFAENPADWLEPLLAGQPRRALLRRCYMNPAGYLEDHTGNRVRFGEFRHALLAAGFEVVDCPRVTRLKNAADVRITLDVMDAVAAPVRYDEFILLSTDADFVPLLLRLRALDRRTRLVAHPKLGGIVRGAADEVIGLDTVADWLGWVPGAADARPDAEDAFGDDEAEDVLAVVRDIMAEAQGPVHLPHLGQMVRARTGQTLRGSEFGGHGTLEDMLAALGLLREEGPGGGWVKRPDQVNL
ncbi:MAG: NYN domain-containing protein [Acetobacteraceae bacterium]|nr:NYN domain-containing protein [Acetobacteraceae bacterium]